MTASAPITNRLRRYRSPCLLILPSLSLPPLECCFGTNPIQAEKLRPDRKAPGSATFATRAVASNGPTPGAWCRNSIRAGARTNYLCRLFVAGALSVIRYAKATAVNIDHGSRHCWCGDQPDCGDRACQ